MNVTTSTAQGRVPVTVIALDGQLDGQSYQDLIKEALKHYKTGARDFLIDLSGVSFMSSAGMVGLHVVALMARGESLPDLDQGWATMKTMTRTRMEKQPHVKLLSPQPPVQNVLEMVGFSEAFDIFTDKDAAVKSF